MRRGALRGNLAEAGDRFADPRVDCQPVSLDCVTRTDLRWGAVHWSAPDAVSTDPNEMKSTKVMVPRHGPPWLARPLGLVACCVLRAVIGRFLRNGDVMRMALPDTGGRNLDKPSFGAELIDIPSATVSHACS